MIIGQILKDKGIQDTVTVQPTTKIMDAVQILSSKRIGALIVQKQPGGFDGILSERDIVREMGREGISILQNPVSDIMTSKLEVCAPDDSALSVLERMSVGRFRHMPVVQNAKMIGLVSIGDVVSARLSQLSMENSALEGMIMGR